MEAQTHEVVVRKDISLANGESLADFTRKAREDGTKFVRQKLNLQPKESGVYPIEIFSKSMVFDVYKYNATSGEDRVRYYACAYSRKNDGSFEFGSLTEVERVTSYRAKTNTPVMKSADDQHEGWNVKKSLFAGVI